MHFARTEEQDELASTIRSLLAKRSDSAAVRAAVQTEVGYDEPLWQTLCEQIGVAALPIPEEHDGAGASLIETAIVLEEIGYALTPSPLLATAIATAALVARGTAEQQATLLPRIAAGEIATLVLDPDVVLDAAAATIVLTSTTDGLRELTGATTTSKPALDQTMRFASVEVERPAPSPLSDIAAALLTAVQVGTAQRGLDMTVAYSKERVQFGRPIGSFQALKHRMADMLVLVEASRSASWAATTAAAAYLQEPDAANLDNLARRAATAKAYCSDALDHIASETVQLHGGIAITWEHDAQLILKRAHALSQLFGQAHQHRRRVSDLAGR
ncbi:MAG: acyl-CoA dehydrogenase [Marmoricola sp.]|jgi:alkylation response protein AidB-like acyl-CoA dehydrogenase|nr:acyl-CoA dehydrogenase [Marmoricola sp.]